MGFGVLAACSNTAPATETITPAVGTTPTVQAGVGSSASGGRPATPPSTTTAVGAAGSPASSAGAAGSPAISAGAAGQSAPAAAGGAAGQVTAGAAGSAPASEGGGGKAAAGAAAGGAAGAAAGGAAGSAGGSGAATADAKAPCLKKPSQVVVVGDSYLNWITHNFPDDFKKEFGGAYRMYAVGGASMASGGISGFIPDQLKMAIMEDKDIIAGVMTGGGNDILIADSTKYPGSDTCKDRTDAPMQQVCKDVIQAAMDTAKQLMSTAADAGMKDVFYLFYPHIPGGGFGGMNPNAILDYSLPLARDLCAQAEKNTSGKLRCHFIDLVPIFEGHADWFADDGIHENAMGSAQMAKEVVKQMKDKCVAQPASSGCCAP
jgi:hypothetical protein